MRDVIGRRESHDLAIRYLCSVHRAGDARRYERNAVPQL